MTKQEQIEEVAKLLRVKEGIYREEIHPCEDDMHCEKCCCLYKSEAEALYEAGYRKVDDFEECRKCPAWSGTDCVRNPYTEGCLDDKVNLKNEIKRLEKENRQLKTECALLDDELRIARQNTIDVLNKLKEKIPLAMSKQYVCAQIDELIKEYE